MRREAQSIAQELIAALKNKEWQARQSAIRELARIVTPDVIPELLRALRDEHQDPNLLNSLLQVLTQAGIDAVTPLIELLAEADANVRIYAALVLGNLGSPQAIPALQRALDDPDPNVRYHAIEALGKLRATSAVDALIAFVESRDFFLAFPALEALAHIGEPRAVPHVMPLLEDEFLYAPAIETLGQLGDHTCIAPLMSRLNRSRETAPIIARALIALYERYEGHYGEGAFIADLVRQAIAPAGIRHLLMAATRATGDDLRSLITVLGWLNDEEVMRTLAQFVGHPDVGEEAAEALARQGRRVMEILLERLDAEDPDTSRTIVALLGRIGDSRAVPALTQLLGAEPDLAIAAANALANIGDRAAFEPLSRLLEHPNAAVRRAAVAALNAISHPDMPGRVVAWLRDPDPRVRECAVRIAGYFGYPECIDLLLERCQDDDEQVRSAAVEHLPYLEDERAFDALRAALRDPSHRVRAAAARALGYVEPERAIPPLLTALEDDDPWVRRYAAQSLSRHQAREALEALERMAQDDPAPFVRITAIQGLSSIGEPRALATLTLLLNADEPELCEAALEALGRTRLPGALSPLLDALRSPDPRWRAMAARALGEHGDREAIEPLRQAAASDTDEAVIQAAINALAYLNGEEAISALIALCAVERCRETCIAALASLGEDAIDHIARGLTHQDAAVRRAIVQALARMKHPRASQRLHAMLGDPDASVRLTTVTALGHLGHHVIASQLAHLAQEDPDEAVRQAARMVLQM